MVRGREGRSGNSGGNRATPYEGAREVRSRHRGRGNDSQGRAKGGRRGRRGGGDKPKSKTTEELDAEMDSYWGKSEEHAAKKLDSDMDTYWKNKNAKPKENEEKKEEVVDGSKEVDKVEDKVEEESAAQELAPVTEEPAKE